VKDGYKRLPHQILIPAGSEWRSQPSILSRILRVPALVGRRCQHGQPGRHLNANRVLANDPGDDASWDGGMGIFLPRPREFRKGSGRAARRLRHLPRNKEMILSRSFDWESRRTFMSNGKQIHPLGKHKAPNKHAHAEHGQDCPDEYKSIWQS